MRCFSRWARYSFGAWDAFTDAALMKLLDRHLARQIVRTFLVALVGLIVLFVVIDLLSHRRDDIVDHDVPWYAVVEYYIALLPDVLVSYSLAGLAVLVSILFVLGASAQRNEFTALLAGGVSLGRFVRVPVLFGAAVSLCLLALSETVGPVAAGRVQAIESEYFGESGQGIRAGRPPISWADLSDGWRCHVAKFNRVALTGEEVLMLALREGAEEQIRAKRIFWDADVQRWMLEDGTWSVFYPDEGMARVTRRITLEQAPIRETPKELFAPFEKSDLHSVGELRRIIREAKQRGIPVRNLQVDLYSRFARAALPFVVVWLAIPLSARIRRGGRAAGIGLAVGLALLYMLVFALGQSLGYSGRLEPVVAAWLANWCFFVVGLALFSRTAT